MPLDYWVTFRIPKLYKDHNSLWAANRPASPSLLPTWQCSLLESNFDLQLIKNVSWNCSHTNNCHAFFMRAKLCTVKWVNDVTYLKISNCQTLRKLIEKLQWTEQTKTNQMFNDFFNKRNISILLWNTFQIQNRWI